jgi:hypothetical protein
MSLLWYASQSGWSPYLYEVDRVSLLSMQEEESIRFPRDGDRGRARRFVRGATPRRLPFRRCVSCHRDGRPGADFCRGDVAVYDAASYGQMTRPNQAVQPTPGSVTPRAISCHFEMNPQNSSRHAARGAPAPVVADL